jgi:hypothetical protein
MRGAVLLLPLYAFHGTDVSPSAMTSHVYVQGCLSNAAQRVLRVPPSNASNRMFARRSGGRLGSCSAPVKPERVLHKGTGFAPSAGKTGCKENALRPVGI